MIICMIEIKKDMIICINMNMVMIIDRPEPFWLKILLTRIPPTAPSTAKRSSDLRSDLACLRIACMVCVDLHVDTDTWDSFSRNLLFWLQVSPAG